MVKIAQLKSPNTLTIPTPLFNPLQIASFTFMQVMPSLLESVGMAKGNYKTASVALQKIAELWQNNQANKIQSIEARQLNLTDQWQQSKRDTDRALIESLKASVQTLTQWILSS